MENKLFNYLKRLDISEFAKLWNKDNPFTQIHRMDELDESKECVLENSPWGFDFEDEYYIWDSGRYESMGDGTMEGYIPLVDALVDYIINTKDNLGDETIEKLLKEDE